MRPEATIHLVDDDDAVRDSLTTLLESHGLTVREYRSAVDFLGDLNARKDGCLILDLHLPVLSGLDLITIMGQRDIRLPVVFITGRSDKEIKERALKAGAIAFLEKPVRDDALMAAIGAALGEQRTALRSSVELSAALTAADAILDGVGTLIGVGRDGGLTMSGSEMRIVDAREIAPRIRHTIIFQLFEHLSPGRSFVIINDHDPRILKQQLELRFGPRADWNYIEDGPDIWRVKISRTTGRPEDPTLRTASSGNEDFHHTRRTAGAGGT